MARMALRWRFLGALARRRSISTQSLNQVLAAQQRGLRHNAWVDFMFGALASTVTTWDDTAAGADGPIPIRVYRPSDADGVLPMVVFMHGGGWVTGSLNMYDHVASNIALRSGAVVVSLDYRLAPTHGWPAGAEDCYAATVDLVGRAATWQADGDRLAVAGDSAGGNLAAVVTQMSRERHGPAITFQALIYPATDLTFGSPSIEENADAPILTKRDLLAFRDLYVRPEDRDEPFVSPLLAQQHSDLPPALIQVAEHDPIRDDGLRYADALRSAGVSVRVTTYVGMPHGFVSLPRISPSAPQALEEITSALREALGGSGPTAS